MTFRPRKSKHDDERDFDRLVAQESLILETTEEICRILNSENITRSELAKRLGKSKGFVTQVLSGERNMTLHTMADFAFALGHHFQVQAIRDKASRSADACSPPSRSHVPLAFLRLECRDQDAEPIADIGGAWASYYKSRSLAEVGSSTIDADAWRSTDPPAQFEDGEVSRHDHEFTLAA
jgi:transcriptional regulator with XRE-family HTH domain